jgi:N-acyl-D-aspartate/D-glutamate deacylase
MVDVLLKGGFVVDGTGAPGFYGDVAVKDGKIAAVAPKLHMEAKKTVDAAGKAVIPGLIDPHVHEEYVCLLDGAMELFMRQGVTTCLSGNCGHSLFNAPTEKAVDYYWFNGLFSDMQREKYKKLFPAWQDFDGYARYWEEKGCNMNMAVLQGHGTIRWLTMGGAIDRKPTAEEKAQIDAILRKNMEQGAWGVSFGLSYVPSRYADTDELCDVVDVISEYDGVAAAHLRHHIGMLECTKEFIEVGRRTGARIQISHLKSVNPECFDAVKEAGDSGMRITVDTIPTSTGHLTRKDRMLQFIMAVSDTLFDKGLEGVKAALHTPEGRKTVLKDAYMFPADRNLTFIVCSEDPKLENRSIADIAKEWGKDPDEVLLDLLGDGKDYTFYLGGASRPDFPGVPHARSIMDNPYVCVGSDELMGDPEDMGGWYELQRRGAMPIFWQMYLKAGIPLEEIVRRNTGMIADHLGFLGRGKLRVGNWADIAVIDVNNYRFPKPAEIDYRNPNTVASGVDTVLVNGVVTVDGGMLKKPFAGKLLRHGR